MHQETLLQVVRQEWIEQRYSRRKIDERLRGFIGTNPILSQKVEQGTALIQQFLATPATYEKKRQRIAQLQLMDARELTIDILVGIAYYHQPELFSSVAGTLASRLNLADKVMAITAVADLIAVLAELDCYDLEQAKDERWVITNRIVLPPEIEQFISDSEVLPPMVCEPLEITHNYASGYLQENSSRILGSGNHHDGDICLDVLNLMGKVALTLNVDFLKSYEEMPTFDFEDHLQKRTWERFKSKSTQFYLMLIEQGNRLYFNHAVDKRGRIYSEGYHLSPQGTAFKKAMFDFAEPEMVEGVP